jgi:hypothetical protein
MVNLSRVSLISVIRLTRAAACGQPRFALAAQG